MKSKMMFMILFFCIFISFNCWAIEKITIFTEEFPPFQYTQEGKIIGASAEVVEAVMKETGLDFEIISKPWARSYRLVQENPNCMIFSISRRPNREELFQWIGIIVPSKYSVFSLKTRNDIQISTLEDMKNYKTGTTIDDARESFLVSKGFSLSNFDRTSGENANIQNYMKLKTQRIDLWPMPDAVAFYVAKEKGDDPSQVLKKSFFLEEISTGGYYLAANLKMPEETVIMIKNALDAFVKKNKYPEILANWGL